MKEVCRKRYTIWTCYKLDLMVCSRSHFFVDTIFLIFFTSQKTIYMLMQHYNTNKFNVMSSISYSTTKNSFFKCYGVCWRVTFTHYTVGNEGSVQDEVHNMEGNVQEEVKYAEGSVQEEVAPNNIRITYSFAATTLKKTSGNTKCMAMNFCYILFGICSIVCHLTAFHIQMFPSCKPLHTYNCRTGCAKHVNVIWPMK